VARRYTIKRDESVQFRIDYERQLDEQQLAVVTAGGGPLLVIAGAGSGKTRAVTYRVARLLETGVAPDRILLVTFTNRAAREMLSRVDQLVKTDVKRIWGGTFHAMGNRILRRCAEVLGYQSNFTILDSEDAKDILEAAIEDAKIDPKARRFPQSSLLQDLHSLCINKDVTIRDLVAIEYVDLLVHIDDIERIFKFYAERKLKGNAMDYDDLLLNWKRALMEFPTVLSQWSQQFQHILVDEYQDTNKIQAEIVDLLAGANRNVMVVGDDAQSIYAWRGANFENIYRFKDRYPDAQVLKLENNYRSSPEIVALANASIKGNQRQFAKHLHSVRPAAGERPALVPLSSVDEQAAFVASRILELRDGGMALAEMAVLYRSHWQSMEMQLELTRRNIPYSIRSGSRFFEQAHIKDMVAHLRIINNPKDEPAWKRVLKLIPSVGKATAGAIWERIARADDPLVSVSRQEFPVKPRATEAWKAFASLIDQLKSPDLADNPSAQMQLVLASSYTEYLRNAYENADSRIEDLEQLAHYAMRFASNEEFLSELSLVNTERFGVPDGPVAEDIAGGDDEDDRVVLSSIHQAKGLEWRAVFIIWAAEGKFPSARSLKDDATIEEERRLFYVATTRARDDLYLCYPLMDNDYGRMSVIQRPSRFISEIDAELFEVWTIE
jgi:DNA helicase-2/ATP-dependent DNA helicase PcrA